MPDRVLQIFRRFHAAFVDAVSNPFYTVNMVRSPLLSGVNIARVQHGSHIIRSTLHGVVMHQKLKDTANSVFCHLPQL